VAATLFGLLPCACAPQSRLHLTQRSHMICAANACACPERPVMRRPTVGKRETPFAPRCFSTCVDALSLQKKTKEETRGEGGGEEVSLAMVLQHRLKRCLLPRCFSTCLRALSLQARAESKRALCFRKKALHSGNGVLNFRKRALHFRKRAIRFRKRTRISAMESYISAREPCNTHTTRHTDTQTH